MQKEELKTNIPISVPMPPTGVSMPMPADTAQQSQAKSPKPVQEAQTLDVVYQINPLFRQKYVQKIKDKDFVKYNGLLTLAKAKGMKSLTVKVIQFPHPDNNHTAICEATLVGWDKTPEKGTTEVIYTEIGDANVTNCSGAIAAHYIRMAATRSKGRAMRDYLGIDSVMEEEILDLDSSSATSSMLTPIDKNQVGAQPIPTQPDIPITQQQINEINQHLQRLSWTGEIFNGFVMQLFPQLTDVGAMSHMQANYVVEQLNLQQGGY